MDKIEFAAAEEIVVETTEKQFELSLFELDMVGGGSIRLCTQLETARGCTKLIKYALKFFGSTSLTGQP